MRSRPVLWLGVLLAASCSAGDAGNAENETPAGPYGGLHSHEAAEAACEHYFAAQYLTPCASPARPAAELTRIKPRFVSACLNQVAAPGSGMTPGAIEACANALEAIACQWQYPPAACNFHGTLPRGAACNEHMQCQSGGCRNATTFVSPGGPGNHPIHCGTCVPVRGEGETCGDGNGCAAGFECITTMTSATDPDYVCTKVDEGDDGARCDESTELCKPGLYCDSGRCRALHTNPGDACGARGGPNGCKAPLSCNSKHVCTPPAAENESCAGGHLCAEGLVCNFMQRCQAVTWAEPGAACDATTYCRIESCPRLSSPLGAGSCPELSSDGEKCVGQFNCDAFSDCLDGVCVLRDSVVCR